MYGFHISDTWEDIWNADVQEKACKSTGAGKDSDLLPCRGSSSPLETLRALLASLRAKRRKPGPEDAGEGRVSRHTSSLRMCREICAHSSGLELLGQDHRWSLHPCSWPAAPPGWLCCQPWLLVPAEPQLRSSNFSFLAAGSATGRTRHVRVLIKQSVLFSCSLSCAVWWLKLRVSLLLEVRC